MAQEPKGQQADQPQGQRDRPGWLPRERVLETYARDGVDLTVTDRRLLAQTPSPAWSGVGSGLATGWSMGARTTWIFLEDLDALEVDAHGHRALAFLGILAILVGLAPQGVTQPLILTGLALIAAYFLTRRRGVKFHAGATTVFVEGMLDEDEEELAAFVRAVQAAKAARLDRPGKEEETGV